MEILYVLLWGPWCSSCGEQRPVVLPNPLAPLVVSSSSLTSTTSGVMISMNHFQARLRDK